MKRILLLTVMVLCMNMGVFAQGTKTLQTFVGISRLPETVRRAVAQDLSMEPVIKHVRVPRSFTVPVKSAQAAYIPLTATFVDSNKFLGAVFAKDNSRYLPQTFVDGMPALFRGMSLNGMEPLKDILKEGLNINKSIHSALYFSGNVDTALSYAIEEGPAIPVVIKVEVTPQLLHHRTPYYDIADNYVFLRNLSAPYVTKVLTFLEVDGKLDWYEVALENDEVVFTPAAADFFRRDRIPIHQFDVPDVNVWYHRWKKIFRH